MRNTNLLLVFTFLIATFSWTQPYPPAAGQPGTTAIPYDSICFVAWATEVEVIRGFVNASDTTVEYQGSNRVTFGMPEDAIGPVTLSTTDCVSLGDSGVAIITFQHPITNGEGWDFAIFENGVTDNFLELGHVEVSSEGIHYVRFPSHSLTPMDEPIGGFGSIEPENIHNLAGKYRVGFGTPFDLEELKDSANIDVNRITHVKIVDVVGSLDVHGTKDAYGNFINDPFPTPFHTGGFDLSGVGVIHEYVDENLSLEEVKQKKVRIYPNPSSSYFFLDMDNEDQYSFMLMDITGKEQLTGTLYHSKAKIDVSHLPNGVYFLRLENQEWNTFHKIVIK